ncbi:MAG: DEAD/DEAH box helicase, partial [Acetobacter sp.]|nr:DEAD/DEAH box helicase [Acetobacter sp.]
VIDESHNFRNSGTKAGGATRYQALMNKVIRSGVKTKVLMLSATPVNNRMTDLKNQVAFITEGKDNALETYGVPSIENTLRKAQGKFNEWLKKAPEQRSTLTLLENMNFDYFQLLDLLTIARSRKHIEKYYNTHEIGKFPERLKPKNITTDIDVNGQFPPLKNVNLIIQRLTLAAYTPLKYVKPDKQAEYGRKYDQKVRDGTSVFKQIDREENMINLMRVNLFKRMESSIASFYHTIKTLYESVTTLLEQIEAHTLTEVKEYCIEDIDIDDLDPDFENLLVGKKIKVLLQDIDLVRWQQDLEDDQKALANVLQEAQTIDENRDAKLQKLKAVITEKIQYPINKGNKKVIIFTAFSDTAEYLYHALAQWAQTTHGVHTALITGGGKNLCTLKKAGKELKEMNTLLTHFSPLSKERHKIEPDATDEIDILIATDCISEGQNLQDCDTLINYDIHWNPVRIIQRFGRVDRLGSKNKAIQLVNFWPNMELDEYIDLENRVSGRMVLLDISATGEENVIQNDNDNAQEMNDLEYRRKQMQQLQEAVVDLEDIDGGVSITDLTLNDFRMDLLHFLKDHKTLLENAPTGY